MPSAGVQHHSKTGSENQPPSKWDANCLCAHVFFSQKDRNAVRPETIIYIYRYIHTILAEYLEYSEFQPYGCEQKKILRISEVEMYIYILENQWDNTHTHTNGTSHVYTKQVQHVYIYIYIYMYLKI